MKQVGAPDGWASAIVRTLGFDGASVRAFPFKPRVETPSSLTGVRRAVDEPAHRRVFIYEVWWTNGWTTPQSRQS